MARRKDDQRSRADFQIDDDVPTRDAVVASAAAAFQRGEHDNPTKAAYAFLSDFYGAGVWALDDAQQDRKAKYLAERITAIIGRG
jgi:hypothetical protein